MTLIEVDNLTKRFGRLTAIHDVSFQVGDGERIGLFGPNGAGKTTVLRILATLSTPTSGRVFIDGRELTRDRAAVRQQIGVLSHETMLYDGLTARENLQLHARIHHIDIDRCDRVLELVGLRSDGERDPSTFSHGMRKRLSLARALLHEPAVLLLDEPYSGLDRRSMVDFDQILDAVGVGTVIMVTHDFKRGFDFCDRALILDAGTVSRDVSLRSLTSPSAFINQYQTAIGLEDN
ncbi:ABC-type transport system ATP-binding protein [Haladaptatus paucihalophilus DX253]|uniref:ABC-type transport system ATP-binding protein n=1 Tax=Haladaptatus paucihalophilus DX253 TaxID=797209 RepID=E7QT30_HALPU|nr:ABC transporter ATP-binding protein [Haladaptatus paucihalophilus]EFW92311.1 ABC-type transport system ATP-binding protein [Haladaptatus paucihalophilus DX253]SHL59586.1 heme exporter protein A [Haladaptatus paucihalophilus DX253]